ncbi:MAG: insulinase family protein, partial [Planctomycetota bacterium]
DNRLVAHYEKGEREEPATPARPTAPAPAPAEPVAKKSSAVPDSYEDLTYEKRPFDLPSGEAARRELPNGMRAFVLRNEGDPVVRISARVLGGHLVDPVEKLGLAGLTAGVLDEAGIPGMDAKALRDHLQGMVADVSVAGDIDGHTVTVTVFPADLDEGLRILRAMLEAPQLEAEAFERIRKARISRLEASESRLGAVTGRLFGKLTWGDVPETRRATKDSLEAITLDDLRARLVSVTGPKRIVIAASGDLDADDLAAKLEAAFAGWKPEGVADLVPRSGKNDPVDLASGLHLRNMAVSQGSVRIGGITVPRTHEDAPALQLLSTVLSRRIFNQVRSVHGLSYQAAARFTPDWRNDSRFAVVFQTKCPSVPFAVHLAKEEIAKVIAGGPTGEELARAKLGVDAGFRRSFGTGFAAAETFAGLEARGVDLDYYAKLRAAYAAVTAEAVKAVAAKYLDPARLFILCVGDLESMKAGDGTHENRLPDFGEPTIHDQTVSGK